MKYLVLVSSLLAFAFCSCTTTDTVTCQPGQLMIYGIGFTSADFDNNSTITAYTANGLFDSSLSSSSVYAYNNAGDTMIIESNIAPGRDYIISLPAAGKQYRITNITMDGLYMETFTHTSSLFNTDNPNEICFNGVKSCIINGDRVLPRSVTKRLLQRHCVPEQITEQITTPFSCPSRTCSA